MKTGIELIAEERQEQITKHGRTIKSDVRANNSEELATAAHALLGIYPDAEEADRTIGEFPAGWNNAICKKMANKPYKERLIIAGALIAAEIDRLNAIEN